MRARFSAIKLTIGHRIALGFGFLLTLSAVIGAFASFSISSTSSSTTMMYEHPFRVINGLADFRSGSYEINTLIEDMLAGRLPAKADRITEMGEKAIDAFDKAAAAYLGPKKDLIAGELAFESWNDIGRRAVSMYASGRKDEALAIYTKEGRPAFHSTIDGTNQVIDFARKKAEAFVTGSIATKDQTIAITWIIVAASIVIGAMTSFMIGRSITRPLGELRAAMLAIAHGDLATEIAGLKRKDEVGEMASAVQIFKDAARDRLRREAEIDTERQRSQEEQRYAERQAIESERELVTHSIGAALAKLSSKDLTYRMNDSVPEAYERLQEDFNSAITQLEQALVMVSGGAHMIGSSTSQITAAADDLSRRTEQQAASLEETVAVLSQLAQSVKKNADGAAQASSLVSKTKADAESSGGIVREAVNAMGRIAKSSSEISQIISVIDEISFQTNLLALNAGVEAARAGDAGRGFAVVASEVRALAQRCAEAAKEINTLIASATSEVREGVELVGHAGKALETIVVQVGDINTVVAEIASSAKEQATSLAEVNVAITQMDQDTQKNAAMVEETTAASHNLRQKTEELVRSIGAFRVEEDMRRSAPVERPRAMRAAMPSIVGNTARKIEAQPRDDWEEF